MRRLAVPLLILWSLGGCIIYEDQGTRTHEGGEDQDRSDEAELPPAPGPDESPGDTATDPSEGPQSQAPPFVLEPDIMGFGDVAIATVKPTDETQGRLDELESIEFFGPTGVEILAMKAQGPDELLLTVSVPHEGYPGEHDLLLEFEDGSAAFLPGALLLDGEPSGEEPMETCP